MDNSKNSSGLKPLTKEQIKAKNIPLRNLWMIKNGQDNLFGPFETTQLHAQIDLDPESFKHLQACNMEDEKWYEFYSIKVFQRRSEKENQISIDPNQKLFVMINGQKNGPYNIEETRKLLNNGHIEHSTPLSIDKGESWIKLWDHPEFDRRAKKTNEELPFLPTPDVLDLVSKTKDEILNTYNNEDPILELAYIGHNKSEKEKHTPTEAHTVEPEAPPLFEDEEDNNIKSSKIKYIIAASLVFVMAISGVLFNQSEEEQGITSTSEATKTPRRSRQTARKPAQNTKRRVVKKITPKAYVKPKTQVNNRRPTRPSSPSRVSRNPNQRMQESQRRMRLEQEAERLDINDPEFQESISRKLSGDYDMDETDDYAQEEPEFRDNNEVGDAPIRPEPPMDGPGDTEYQEERDNYNDNYPEENEPEYREDY